MRKKTRFFFKITILAFIIGVLFAGARAFAAEDSRNELYKNIELFSEAITSIQSDYVKDVDSKDLIYGALDGMLSSLDGYSQFLTPEDFKEMQIDTKGEFGGLGIEIGMRDGVLTVISPIDGTPADAAGLKSGDRVVKIEGELTRGISLSEAVKKLRGEANTSVTLSVWRESEGKIIDFNITRGVIKIKSIKVARIIEDTIAYIKLVEFQESTPKELEKELVTLEKNGMRGLVLDLRNNPGGLLDVAYEVSDKFLSEGVVVVSLKGRHPKQNKVYTARSKRSFTDFPMAVLVNEGSASASEIVAGAIKDNRRGIIVGTKTFGKGSVQTVTPLKDGSAIRITTSDYYTPANHSISEVGIIPDVTVEKEKVLEAVDVSKEEELFEKIEPDGKKKEKEVYDNQLDVAIGIVKGTLLGNDKN